MRRAAAALGEDLTAAAGMALRNQKWGRAGQYAAALLLLDPSAPDGAALAEKATTGQKLSARLAEARDAARLGHWREALRLALAVTAAQKGFPGAAALVADARLALTPKPQPTAQATTTTPTTVTPATSGGSSSGSTSQPPPP